MDIEQIIGGERILSFDRIAAYEQSIFTRDKRIGFRRRARRR